MHPVKFCATSCAHQKSGELSVWDMYRAWEWVMAMVVLGELITPGFIEKIGELVEPVVNKDGFRTVNVMIRGGVRQPPNPSVVRQAIKSLCEQGTSLTPEEWYREFELIHPFVDGNGRVGAIVFNVLSGTLHSPIIPPDVFAVEKRFGV